MDEAQLRAVWLLFLRQTHSCRYAHGQALCHAQDALQTTRCSQSHRMHVNCTADRLETLAITSGSKFA